MYFVVQFLLGLLAAVVSAIVAYGAIASTIVGLLGPIFIPFLVFDKLDWLFWGWLKAYLGFSFYKVVAAATMNVLCHVLTNYYIQLGQSVSDPSTIVQALPLLILLVLVNVYRRNGDRLGNASAGSELPSCGRASQGGLFSFRRSGQAGTKAGTAVHGAEAAAAFYAGGGRPRAADAGRGLLPADAEGVADGAKVFGIAGPEIFRDHRPLQTRLRQPDAGLWSAPREPSRRRGGARAPAAARHLPGERP